MKPKVISSYLTLLIQSSTQRVLEVFFNYPELEFSLSDMATKARVAKPHMNKLLTNLKQLNMIQITKLSKIWRIKSNQENNNFIKSKLVYNLNFTYHSGLIEFLNDHFKNPKAIILFGSFRWGEDLSTSDIDIAIETNEVREYQTTELAELVPFEKKIKRKIQIHLFHRSDIDSHVFNNISNGIVLNGFLEVRP